MPYFLSAENSSVYTAAIKLHQLPAKQTYGCHMDALWEWIEFVGCHMDALWEWIEFVGT